MKAASGWYWSLRPATSILLHCAADVLVRIEQRAVRSFGNAGKPWQLKVKSLLRTWKETWLNRTFARSLFPLLTWLLWEFIFSFAQVWMRNWQISRSRSVTCAISSRWNYPIRQRSWKSCTWTLATQGHQHHRWSLKKDWCFQLPTSRTLRAVQMRRMHIMRMMSMLSKKNRQTR